MGVPARVSSDNNHVAVRVRDLEQAVDFYENVLGLPRIRFMGDPDRPRTVFFPGIQLVRAEEDDTSVKGVFDHVGISVENIEEVCASLEAQGVEFETPLTERHFEEIGTGLKLAFLRDPEGNRIELVHWL
jgi:catechol 2,3-dioxygenase-like lactoylglutathione lyase family enzyme